MRHQTSLAYVTPSDADNRQFARSRMLLGAVFATIDGTKALDGIIRNLSARGASVHSEMDLSIGDQLFLLDTRNHVAYLATVRWRKSKSSGVEFIRTYDLDSALPVEVSFLEKLLIEAKLRQILLLERRGIQLEHAASIVGLTEKHLGRVDDHNGIATEFGSLIDKLIPFFEKGILSSKRAPKHEYIGGKFRFFQRRSPS